MVGLLGGTRKSKGFRTDDVDLDVFRDILYRMANGEAVTTICQEPDQPDYSVFQGWVRSSEELFQEYSRARAVQADYYADETVAIADTELNPIRARNRMDARRWHASKIAPRKYGDQIRQEINQVIEKRLSVDLSKMNPDAREDLRRALLQSMRTTPSQTIDGEFKREG